MKVTKATKNDLVILNDIYNSELRRIYFRKLFQVSKNKII